jgi:transposase
MEQGVTDRQSFVLQAIISFLQPFFTITFTKRIIAAILLSTGKQPQHVASILNMGLSTVYKFRKALNSASSAEEITSLFQMKPGCGRKSKAGNAASDIKEEIEHGVYSCLRDIQSMISNKFKIVLSLSATARCLAALEIKRFKAASFPAKANPQLQKTFYDETLHPLMNKAKRGKIHLLFMDGSHFVMGSDFLGYIYGTARRFTHSHSGRQRYNVLGALDYVTKKILTVTNAKYLTATEVITMLNKIAAFYGTGKPIRVVLDNARYQKCEAVTQTLNELQKTFDIDLVFLPSYSPNLNLVERIWRFVKTEIRSKYTSEVDFSTFCTTIDDVIASTTGSSKKHIDSLIGEKVQLYNSLIPVDPHTFVMPREEAA